MLGVSGPCTDGIQFLEHLELCVGVRGSYMNGIKLLEIYMSLFKGELSRSIK
jgi:hypothetical protein